MFVTQRNTFLPGYKCISASQFEQEMLQFADEHLFEVGLKKMLSLSDTKEFEYERVVDYLARLQCFWGRLTASLSRLASILS